MAVVLAVVGAYYATVGVGFLGHKLYKYMTRKEVKVLWYESGYNPNGSHQARLVMRVRGTANIEIKVVRPEGHDQPMIVEAVCVSNAYYAVKEALESIPSIHRNSANVAVIILHKVAPHVHGSQATSGRDLRLDYPKYNKLGLIVEFQVHDKRIRSNKENTESVKLLAEFLMKFAA